MTILEHSSRPSHCASDDDDLDHVVCCRDENRAICGRDASDLTWTEQPENLCVVCTDLDLVHLRSDTCPIDGTPCPDDDEETEQP